MDKNNINIGINTGTGSGAEEGSENHRLTITKAAEQVLVSAVEQVNEGFQGGKVNRNQMAIWAILRFGENFGPDDIREVRAEHVDEFSALDAILRRAKGNGKLPPELKAYLQKQMGYDESPKKKSKKTLQNDVTNDYIENKKT